MSICSIGSTDCRPAGAVSTVAGESSVDRSPLVAGRSASSPHMSSSVSGRPSSPATHPPRVRGLRVLLAAAMALALPAAAHGAAAGPSLTVAGALLLQTPAATAGRATDTPSRPGSEVTSQTLRATRAELTAALDRAERTAARASGRDRERAQAEATAIRARLRDGDFRAGDRLAMSLSGDTTSREIAVREGPQIELPYGIPPLSLTGVLRAELNDAVAAHLRKYVREPDVRVRSLQRLSVAGAVGRPGVYWVPPDMALAEVIMRAGGVGAGAKTDKVVVTRAGKEVIDRKTFARFSREGRTVEESNLQSGDEIRVPVGSQRNWSQIATYTFIGVSALTALLALIRSSYQ